MGAHVTGIQAPGISPIVVRRGSARGRLFSMIFVDNKATLNASPILAAMRALTWRGLRVHFHCISFQWLSGVSQKGAELLAVPHQGDA